MTRLRAGDAIHMRSFENATIVLDLRQDSYAMLTGELHQTARRLLDGQDIPPAWAPSVSRLIERGVFVPCEDPPCPRSAVMTDRSAPLMPFRARTDFIFITTFLRLLAAVVEVRRRPLHDILRGLELAKARASARPPSGPRPANFAARLSASMQLAALILGANEFCLPRSICAMRILLDRGYSPTLVMAVTERPFTAHSWVQLDDWIVTDTPDRVAAFKPILIL